jgi:hypothetical protein
MSRNLVHRGIDIDARFTGAQVKFALAWQAMPELKLPASVDTADLAMFIRDTGPAEVIKLVGVAANYRF